MYIHTYMYTRCIWRSLQSLCNYSTPCHHMQYGFTAGKQTLDISEFCRMAVQKSVRWEVPLYIMKLDVHRAFDALRHGVIHDALINCQCTVRLQLALLRELAHCDITLKFQGVVWEGIPYSNGDKQGGSDTPEIWKRVLHVALRRARQRWDAPSLGLILVRSLGSIETLCIWMPLPGRTTLSCFPTPLRI